MTEAHQVHQENLAAYALDALDADEIAALESHLRTCDSCTSELADYQRVSTGLLAGLPARAPRPNVRRSLQRRLSGASSPRRPLFKWSFSQMAVTSALVLLIGLNIVSVFQVYSLKQEQAELSGNFYAEQTAIAMLAYPSTQSFAFNQDSISGSLLVDKQRNLLAIFAWNLPSPPAGKAYQMWLIDPQGDRTSGGFLTPDSDRPFVIAVIASQQPLTGFVGLGVTVEPVGGSPKPTGPRVLRVDF